MFTYKRYSLIFGMLIFIATFFVEGIAQELGDIKSISKWVLPTDGIFGRSSGPSLAPGATTRNAATVNNENLNKVLKPSEKKESKHIASLRFDDRGAVDSLDSLLSIERASMVVGSNSLWNTYARGSVEGISFRPLNEGLTPLSTSLSVSLLVSTDIDKIKNGALMLSSQLFFTLGEDSRFNELYPFAVPLYGHLKSDKESDKNQKNITPANEIFFNTSDGKVISFGLIASPTNEEETKIIHDRMLSSHRTWALYTVANIISSNDKTILLGEGSKLQVALRIDGGKGFIGRSLLGSPGSTITLHPGVSVTWNEMDLSPEDSKVATFIIGLKEGTLIIEKIKDGKLKFRRKDSKGKVVNGLLIQTEKGVVEKLTTPQEG